MSLRNMSFVSGKVMSQCCDITTYHYLLFKLMIESPFGLRSLSFVFGEVTIAGLLFFYYNKIIIKEALGSGFFDAKLEPHFSKIVR